MTTRRRDARSLIFTLFLQPTYGAISDRVGRRPLLIWFGVTGTMGTIPFLFSLQATKSAFVAFLLIGTAWIIVGGYTSIKCRREGRSLSDTHPRDGRGRSLRRDGLGLWRNGGIHCALVQVH